MTIRPERGGRITSLKLRGSELLDQGIGVDRPDAEGFVEGGAWGWDEMVPNVEPTDSLPDHGEAWRRPWTVVEREPARAVMRATGRTVPWRLERTVVLAADGIRLRYRYTNVGEAPHAAFWCAHPLFKYEPGMEIGAAVPSELDEGTSTKVFLPRAGVDRVSLGWRSGTRIELAWDAGLTPDVAIWLCNGDLGGYRQVAVEPATASPLLQPGESLEWWLRISAL